MALVSEDKLLRAKMGSDERLVLLAVLLISLKSRMQHLALLL